VLGLKISKLHSDLKFGILGGQGEAKNLVEERTGAFNLVCIDQVKMAKYVLQIENSSQF
jgi:hypothetical protein